MSKCFAFLCLISAFLFSSDYEKYKNLQKDCPHLFESLGQATRGEIEILLNEDAIKKAEEHSFEYLLKKGYSKNEAYEFSRVGVVAEDAYILLLRDAVLFPSMTYGTYNRLIWKSYLDNKETGAVILPLIGNDTLVLNLNYRHALRSWQIELPRGLSDKDEPIEQTARRELLEETGFVASRLIQLGHLNQETGLCTASVPLFLAYVSDKSQPKREHSEAILQTLQLKVDDVKQMIERGYLDVEIQGNLQRVSCLDPLLNSSLYLAELKGVIKN